MAICKASTGRALAILLLAILLLVTLSCVTMTPDEIAGRLRATMEIPSKSLWVELNSIPSGATVYGDQNGQLGTKLGTTPLTLKYTSGYNRIYGNMPDETLVMNQTLVKSFLAFKCILLKEGYDLCRVYQVIQDDSGLFAPVIKLAGVRKTYTVLLNAPEPAKPSAAAFPTQQQQQQQQTVIIPATSQSGKPGSATVMITANIQEAEVFIDGVFVGNVPANLKLADGIHIVEVKRAGYSTYRKEIRIYEGSELRLYAELIKED